MTARSSHGFLIAAPHSGSGKTTITLGILAALRKRSIAVAPAKAGPDFIDPAFHTAASGESCINLDAWAMREQFLLGAAGEHRREKLFVVEAMMGLFDGAADGTGSAADLAQMLGLPIALVVDCAKQSHSIAALVSGFHNFKPKVSIAGVILNRIGSQRHEVMMREALDAIAMPVFGTVYRHELLVLPSRHLGLVQAGEHPQLEGFLEQAATIMEGSIDLDAMISLETNSVAVPPSQVAVPPVGQKIAIARDDAFRFTYEHVLNGWRKQGAELTFFSPLANEAPDTDCDSVYLPGGYPELHGGKLASNENFLNGLRDAAQSGKVVYGECGGFMVLGESLIDADGVGHKMANLLPLCTSFETRKLQLGYRVATCKSDSPLGPSGSHYSAHEFHYSTIVDSPVTASQNVDPLFRVVDARGDNATDVGMKSGSVMGSYMHLIDRREQS